MQSRRIKYGFCIALVALFGCASAYVYPIAYRAPYGLETFGDLLVSNSSIFFEKNTLTVQDSRLKIEIPVLISNQSVKESYRLRVGDASFTVRDLKVKSVCESKNSTGSEIELSPQSQVQIKCTTFLPKEGTSELRSKDSLGKLGIPYLPGNGKLSELRVSYQFRIEDFR